MSRVYNFSDGPAVLPEEVLKEAAAEMLDYEGSGQSVMEMSHRSKTYQSIIDGCSSLLRDVMQIPDDYEVLFLQGGASTWVNQPDCYAPFTLLRAFVEGRIDRPIRAAAMLPKD